MNRRDFLKLGAILPTIGKVVKDLAQENVPVIELKKELDDLDIELAAWDKTSDAVWQEWTNNISDSIWRIQTNTESSGVCALKIPNCTQWTIIDSDWVHK